MECFEKTVNENYRISSSNELEKLKEDLIPTSSILNRGKNFRILISGNEFHSSSTSGEYKNLTVLQILRNWWDSRGLDPFVPVYLSRGHVCRAIRSRQARLGHTDSYDKSGNVCAHCKTTKTTLWRRFKESVVCNACGLYYKMHGIQRPFFLQNDCIRRRKKKVDRRA